MYFKAKAKRVKTEVGNLMLECSFCVCFECHRMCNVNKSFVRKLRRRSNKNDSSNTVWKNVCLSLLTWSVMSREGTSRCLHVLFSTWIAEVTTEKWRLNAAVGSPHQKPHPWRGGVTSASGRSERRKLFKSPWVISSITTRVGCPLDTTPSKRTCGGRGRRTKGLQHSHHESCCLITWRLPAMCISSYHVVAGEGLHDRRLIQELDSLS